MSIMDRGNLRSRYSMTGRLVMDTALHIGGGHETSTITDSPVVRNTAGEPIIPGSSLKGAFRAAVERLLPSLGLRTCQLNDSYAECLSTNQDLGEHYEVMRGQIGRNLRDRVETRRSIRILRQAIERLGATPHSLQDLG